MGLVEAYTPLTEFQSTVKTRVFAGSFVFNINVKRETFAINKMLDDEENDIITK